MYSTTIQLICFVIASFAFYTKGIGQMTVQSKEQIISYFDELKTATKQNTSLWNKDLYGPILLVEPASRAVLANYPDSAGILQQADNLFSGVLPPEAMIANTSVYWNGRSWAMVMLPLPVNKHDRIQLLAHELFHVHQPALGFKLYNVDNNHLDTKDGRIYLRLELEALKKALLANQSSEIKEHLTNALIFRKYRHALFPRADSTENLLELNEGLAEYTGFIISQRKNHQINLHFEQSLKSFLNNPTFVRAFAYQTTPMYGTLLYKSNKNWNKDINLQTNLTDYFIKTMKVMLPGDLKKAIKLLMPKYQGENIVQEEKAREDKTNRLIAEYKHKFIMQPHLDILLEHMEISFDPRNIMPIEQFGTIYPNLKIVDAWGILTVTKGALLSTQWDKISVASPIHTSTKNISGDGWTLELKEGYLLHKDETTGNYTLTKE